MLVYKLQRPIVYNMSTDTGIDKDLDQTRDESTALIDTLLSDPILTNRRELKRDLMTKIQYDSKTITHSNDILEDANAKIKMLQIQENPDRSEIDVQYSIQDKNTCKIGKSSKGITENVLKLRSLEEDESGDLNRVAKAARVGTSSSRALSAKMVKRITLEKSLNTN